MKRRFTSAIKYMQTTFSQQFIVLNYILSAIYSAGDTNFSSYSKLQFDDTNGLNFYVVNKFTRNVTRCNFRWNHVVRLYNGIRYKWEWNFWHKNTRFYVCNLLCFFFNFCFFPHGMNNNRRLLPKPKWNSLLPGHQR